jgi:hypothetical protein
VGEGDIVTTLFTPGGSYRIKAVKDDEILDCENLVTGTRLGLRATSVTLLEKVATAPQPLEAPQPKVDPSRLHAKILLKESEYVGQVLPVSRVSPNEMGYTVTLPDGQSRWFKADLVQILDAEIEEKALPAEPVEPESIEFNDLVEVVADNNDAVGLVGAVGRVKIVKGESVALLRSADRIGVEIDEQLAYFNRTELKIQAKKVVQLDLIKDLQGVGYAPEASLWFINKNVVRTPQNLTFKVAHQLE